MVFRLIPFVLLVLPVYTTPQDTHLGVQAKSACRDRMNMCRCDSLCAQYGDCCRDSSFFVAEEQVLGASPFTCEKFETGNIYIMGSCPPEWNDPETRFRCENSDTSYRDPLLDAPVTSSRTNITYRNWHCASCHRDIEVNTTSVWSIYFSCNISYINLSDEEILKHMMYDTESSSWYLNVTENIDFLIFDDIGSHLDGYRPDKRHIYSCTAGILSPETSRKVFRECRYNVVDTCPESWTDEEVIHQCQAYIEYVCGNGTQYRNQYCGLCNNNGTFENATCMEVVTRVTDSPLAPPDFTILLDWHRLRKRETCQLEVEEYDPFSRTCRKVFEDFKGVTMDDSTQSPYDSLSTETLRNTTFGNVYLNNASSSNNFLTCQKFRLEPHEFRIINNETMLIYVPTYNLTYYPHEYRLRNDSWLDICIPDFDSLVIDNLEEEELPTGLAYVTVVGLSLSVIFLLLHLVVFVMTPKLRNLSSMNLASLSVSLLCMYCAFIVGSHLNEKEIPCIIMAIITHYSLLASFCWMLTIAFDISRVLQQATTQLLIMSGKHWQRFAIYSACSWLVPAAIVIAALTFDLSTTELTSFEPGYGVENCWFHNAEALLVFCVIPLFIVMLLNIFLFSWSTYIIYTTTSEMKNMSSNTTRQDFKLYLRLAVIMGLTWVIGLIAAYVNVEGLWYVFVLFNTLQGLSIFLAFTCSRKVWNELNLQQRLFPNNQTSRRLRVMAEAQGRLTPGTVSTST